MKRQWLAPLAAIALLPGCGPSSMAVRLWTIGAILGVVILVTLFMTVKHAVQRIPIDFQERVQDGFIAAGILSLVGSPFYGFAFGSFGGFMMLVIMGAALLGVVWLLDH
jgi:hydrogenase-4 membrane subunit HyfE